MPRLLKRPSGWPRSTRSLRCAVGAFAALILALSVATAQAQADSAVPPSLNGTPLDTTFADGGVLFLAPASGLLPITLALQPDGHLLLLAAERAGEQGRLALLRLQPDGSPDLAFGTRGVWRSAPWPSGSGNPYATVQATLAVAPDGRILAGQGDDRATVIFRLSADGRPDPDFGTEGQTRLGFSVQTILPNPDGSLVLVGAQSNLANDARPVWALARLTADGRKDPAFQGGFVRPFGLHEGSVGAASLLPDGTFLVVGDQHDAARHTTQPVLVKFGVNGRPDASFGVAGQASPGLDSSCSLRDLTLDSAGRILAAGWCAARQHLAARFTPGGTLDPSFGQGGLRRGQDGLGQITTQPGGLVTVAGAQLGGEEMTFAFLEQWPPDGQPDPANASARRLDLSTVTWPSSLPQDVQFAGVVALLSDALGRLLVLAQTHLEVGEEYRNSGVLLRFAAPLELR